MKKLIPIIYFFFTIISLKISAQQISGTLKDNDTKLGIPNAKIEVINYANGSHDSALTNLNGVWYYNLPTSVEDPEIPSTFYLYQNYPNPFNPSTKIQFLSANDGSIELFVHNVLGELVDYKQEYVTEGVYEVEWFSKGSAGVYFYTIKSGEKSLTKKMIQLDGGNGLGFGNIRTVSNNTNVVLPKGSSQQITLVYSKISHLTDSMNVTVNGGENFLYFLTSIHSTLRMIDLHNDVLEVMTSDPNYHLKDRHTYNHTDIPRLQEGGVDVQFFSLWVSPSQFSNYYQQAQVMLGVFDYELSQNTSTMQQATTMNECIQINTNGKIAAVLGVEGGHHIENSLTNLESLYNSGMRYMTITWNNSTDWAISAQDPLSATQGLTEFGRHVIRTMDSLGIIIDVSHVGIQTIIDILDETDNPIIASHSGARALYNHYRNLYDWQIVDIANSGGVVGIVFYPYFLNGTSNTDIDDVIAHIDYIKNLVGIDHVAIGSDFDGIGVTPSGLEDVSKFPNLTSAILEHGYTVDEVEKILGGNFKRVFEQVCGNK